ncbi:hypothetical protein [Leminorella grimontii]|uniref:hypothetical protein n=1 Tax=Leminorella grimontii TaxID=82981 RepID=UPI00321FB9B3
MSNLTQGTADVMPVLNGLKASLPGLEKLNKKIDDVAKNIGIEIGVTQKVASVQVKQLSGNINHILSGLSRVSAKVLAKSSPQINQSVKKFFFISHISERIKNDISLKVNVSQPASKSECTPKWECTPVPEVDSDPCCCEKGDGDKGGGSGAFDTIAKIVGFIADLLSILDALKKLKGLGPALKNIVGGIGKVLSAAKGLVKGIFTAGKSVISNTASFIGRRAGQVFSAIGKTASSIAKRVMSGVSQGYSRAKGAISSAGTKAKELFSAGKDKAKGVFNAVKGKVGGVLSSGGEKAKAFFSSGKEKASNLIASGKERAKSAFNFGKGLFDKIGSLVSKGKDVAKSAAGRVVGKGGGLLSRGAGLIAHMAGPLASMGKNLISKAPGVIKSVAGGAFSVGKSLLGNGKILSVLGKVASVGLRVGRLATPLGWASLAAEGAIRLGYHAYKKYQASKEQEASPEGEGKPPTEVYPQTVTPDMAASAASSNSANYTVNSNPQFQINVLPGTPEQQANDIRLAAMEGVKQGEKQLTAVVTGGLS